MVGSNLILLRRERAAQGQWCTEKREKVPGAARGLDNLGKLRMLAREIKAGVSPSGHVFETVRSLMPIVEISGRDRIEFSPIGVGAKVLVDHDQIIGIAERQRLEQHRAHDGKQCSGGADSERHDKDRGEGETRRPGKSAETVS